MYYFAYGSNMNKKHLDDYLGQDNAVFVNTGILKDNIFMYHGIKNNLNLKGKGDVVRRKGSKVYGVIYKVNENIMKKLDKKEGVHNGIYEREYCKIKGKNRTYNCVTYRMINDKISRRMEPSFRYKTIIITAALYHNFPKKYLSRLKNIQC